MFLRVFMLLHFFVWLFLDMVPTAFSQDAPSTKGKKEHPFMVWGRICEEWGGRGDGPGAIQSPLLLEADNQGCVYTVDLATSLLQKCSQDGTVLWSMNYEDLGSTPIYMRTDLQGRLHLVAGGKTNLFLFSPEGTLAEERDCPTLGGCTQFTVHEGQYVAVFPWKNMARGVNSSGDIVWEWFSDGQEPLNAITAIDVDRTGQAYLLDGANERMVQLDSQGRFVQSWPVPFKMTQARPYALRTDNRGRLYLLGAEDQEVHLFTDRGVHLGPWYPGVGALGSFFTALDVDDRGWVYAATSNYRIKVFQPHPPSTVETFPSPTRKPDPAGQIALLGVDGMEWEITMDLVRQGKMPNVRRLMSGGAYGYVDTLSPSLSPAIWATIATSRHPEDHGIQGFLKFHKKPLRIIVQLDPQDRRNVVLVMDVKSYEGCGKQKMRVQLMPGRFLKEVSLTPSWQQLRVPVVLQEGQQGPVKFHLSPERYSMTESDRKAFMDEWGQYVNNDPKRVVIDPSRCRCGTAVFRDIRLEDEEGDCLSEISLRLRQNAGGPSKLCNGWFNPEPGGKIRVATGSPFARVSSRDRACAALWDIFSGQGRDVAVIGYHTTYPAEAVRGVMVAMKDPGGILEEKLTESFYPKTYKQEVSQWLTPRDLETLYPMTSKAMPFLSRPQGRKILPNVCNQDLIHVDIALDALKRFRPRFFAVYLQSLDLIGHYFAPFPHAYSYQSDWDMHLKKKVSVELVGTVLEEAYIRMDKLIGRLLDALDEDATVLLVSDHGFPIPAFNHLQAPPGTIILHGKNVAPVGEFRGASVYDVAPTLLYLAGLPLSREMEGRPLLQAVHPGYREAHPVQTIESYDRAAERPTEEAEELDEEKTETLKELGYIG